MSLGRLGPVAVAVGALLIGACTQGDPQEASRRVPPTTSSERPGAPMPSSPCPPGVHDLAGLSTSAEPDRLVCASWISSRAAGAEDMSGLRVRRAIRTMAEIDAAFVAAGQGTPLVGVDESEEVGVAVVTASSPVFVPQHGLPGPGATEAQDGLIEVFAGPPLRSGTAIAPADGPLVRSVSRLVG